MSEPAEYFLIITIQHGNRQLTRTATATPSPGGTRADLYRWMVGTLPEELRDSVVVFFFAEPNGLHREEVRPPT